MADIANTIEIEKKCLNRIETSINFEKDPNLKNQIEETGRAICKCMSERATNPFVIKKVMNAAIRALPTYTVGRPDRIRLK